MTVSRKELVEQAIRFHSPARVPVVFWNRDPTEGDVMLYHLALGAPGDGTPNTWNWCENEWGYRLESLGDGTMGHPVEPFYPELPAPESIHVPALREAERMSAVPAFLETCGDRYRLASFDLSGFTVYTLLRGFENAMQDFLLDPVGFAALMDRIVAFECDLMRLAARSGFHGIHFADDWGTQTGLMISPSLWRRLFKPRYARQFAFAHELGLHTWYHCCGNFEPILDDFHEIGADVINISQPNVVDVAAVGKRLRGRQCFMMPISYQTVSISGTPAEIHAEARRLYDLLGAPAGGFIGYVEEYGVMGMSARNYRACAEAFRELGRTETATSRRGFLRQSAGAMVIACSGLGNLGAAPGERKRVAVAGFSHETNTFHPVSTESFSFSQAADLRLDAWSDAGLLIVKGLSARPTGGGTIAERPCREAMEKVVASIREALPAEAVFLRLHGAMYAEGVGPAETELVRQVRGAVGPKVPIACTFDLHGNIPARLGQFGDILVGLKTAPHTDGAQTAELAGRILRDTLAGRVRPVSYVLPVPMILQGEKAMTTAEPFRSLVEEARRMEREGIPGHTAKVLAATLFVGCAWTDSPDTGMSVMITADGSRAAARAAAIHLARKIWEARREFGFGCETAELEAGVTRALAAKESTVFLTDSGDNVTASTPGDLPVVLRHLVERKVKSAVVAGLNDKAATARCFEAGEGKQVRLSIGATVERRFGPPLQTEVEVVRLVHSSRQAVGRIGSVEVILAEGPTAFTDPRQFEACGIDPLRRKLVVVKEGYLYPGLTRIAPRYIMLLTPGAGDMRIERLDYVRRRKPVFPFEPDTPFDPESAPQ